MLFHIRILAMYDLTEDQWAIIDALQTKMIRLAAAALSEGLSLSALLETIRTVDAHVRWQEGNGWYPAFQEYRGNSVPVAPDELPPVPAVGLRLATVDGRHVH